MQAMDALGRNERVGVGRGCWKVLALCLALTRMPGPSSQHRPKRRPPRRLLRHRRQRPFRPASADSPPYPDASYTEGRLRPAMAGVWIGVKMQASSRPAARTNRLPGSAPRSGGQQGVAGLDAAARTAFQATQASWRSDTDRYCRVVPNGSVQQHWQAAQECRLYRVANRADPAAGARARRRIPRIPSNAASGIHPLRAGRRGMDDQLKLHAAELMPPQGAAGSTGCATDGQSRWPGQGPLDGRAANWAADTDKHCSRPLTAWARRWMHSRASSIVTPTVRWNCRRGVLAAMMSLDGGIAGGLDADPKARLLAGQRN